MAWAAGAGPLSGEGSSPPGSAPADQSTLVDALYWLVYGLTNGMPPPARPCAALIAVDDAQWSDAAKLRVLVRLTTGLENLPVAIVVAVRTEDLEPEAAVAGMVPDSVADGAYLKVPRSAHRSSPPGSSG